MDEESKANRTVVNPETLPKEASQRRTISDDELRLMAPSYDLQWTSYAYGQAYTLYQRVFKVVGQKMNLTIPQFLVLYMLLLAERPLGPTELSKLLPIEPQSITTVLDRLEDKAFVVRRRSPKDRRAVKVRLTQDGHDLLRDQIPMMKRLLEYTVGTLSPEERRSLATISQKLSRAAANLLGANPEHLDEMLELFTRRLAKISQTMDRS